MRQPNLNALRAFDAAARHLTFAHAAASLHVTQGAVAQQVRRLEQDLGLPLFRRHARGLELTEAGAEYAKAVREALSRIETATAALTSERKGITLSVPPSIASKWLLPRLPRFADMHPDIALQLVASAEVTNWQTDAVDIAIRQGPPPNEAGLRVWKLAEIDLCAVAAPEIALRFRDTDLSRAPLVEDAHAHWTRRMGSPQHVLRFNQTDLALEAAASGQGIALAPKLLVELDVATDRLAVLWTDAAATSDAFYVVSRAEPKQPAREVVVAWIRTEARA